MHKRKIDKRGRAGRLLGAAAAAIVLAGAAMAADGSHTQIMDDQGRIYTLSAPYVRAESGENCAVAPDAGDPEGIGGGFHEASYTTYYVTLGTEITCPDGWIFIAGRSSLTDPADRWGEGYLAGGVFYAGARTHAARNDEFVLIAAPGTDATAMGGEGAARAHVHIRVVSRFADVAPTGYCAFSAAWAQSEGFVKGYSDTEFRPNAECSRAQILTYLWRQAHEPAAEAALPGVPAAAYYYNACAWAAERGIVSAADLRPGAVCTRADAVTFLWKRAGSPEPAADVTFADVPADAAYAKAVAWAVEKGITTGTTETTFSPENPCTRGQIVTFLYREIG